MFHWVELDYALVCLETGAEVRIKGGPPIRLVYVKPDVTVDVSYTTPFHGNEVVLGEYDTMDDAVSALGKMGDYLQAYKP